MCAYALPRSFSRCFFSRTTGQSTSSSSQIPLRVCIVGSGPAGFYTAHQLLKRNKLVHIDILDKCPVPFGLVRFGVAPDHPEIKNCINQFTTLARKEQCRFIGNVGLGRDVSLAQLRPYYHALVMAYGAEDDRVLGIPGEHFAGVYSARSFVGWYNGLPEHRELNPDLSGEVAMVIGNGNVALDVARMLLTPVDNLKRTDMCSHAVEALAESKVRRVQLVGRRGPLQVAFTIKELREMTKLPGCRTNLDPSYLDSVRSLIPELPRPRRRITELMMNIANEQLVESRSEAGKEWGISFLRSPVEIHCSKTTGRVGSVTMEINRLEESWESAKAVPMGSFESVKCDLVLRSIGYKTVLVDKDLPFDPTTGIVPNIAGRTIDRNKRYIEDLYCSGWVKTGPVGVIITTMNKSFETAEVVHEDFTKGKLPVPQGGDVLELLNELGIDTVSFSDWEAIDKHEIREGEKKGKPREKVVDLDQMMNIVYNNR